ncbi:MAG: hypothetical protein U0165_06265 [Polyangiaceae bacterium]
MASTLVDPELAAPSVAASPAIETLDVTIVRAVSSTLDIESLRHPDERFARDLLWAQEPALREKFQVPTPSIERARRIASGQILGPSSLSSLASTLGELVQAMGLDLDVAEIEVVATRGVTSAARFPA